jgi:hypothetical protein
MRLHILEKSSLKRPFLIGGTATGLCVSVWYLYRSVAGLTHPPDPIWTRLVNVALIMFVPVYIANLLRRVVELIMRKGGQD